MNELNHEGFERSCCPVANALDVIGDKWSLLIVRDLVLGKIRYGEFAQSPEGIPSNILASRLKRLEAEGIIEKQAYTDKPLRYQYALTEKGRDLVPILETMVAWALKHVPGTQVFPYYRVDIESKF
jgi:DNA-binding HxlR family transcriptional regulator